MATIDKSIFRERAIEKYMRRREIHVILRLVSPPMFLFLWALLFLAIGGGVLVGLIQVPELIQGNGIVVQVQQKVNNKPATQEIVVLLLLSPDQQKNIKAGEPVSISITAANITFNSTVGNVQTTVMSPTDIRTQYNVPAALAQTITGPSVVASATVQPASLAKTYLGSECVAQVRIGSQSALSLVPGLETVPAYLDSAHKFLSNLLPK